MPTKKKKNWKPFLEINQTTIGNERQDATILIQIHLIHIYGDYIVVFDFIISKNETDFVNDFTAVLITDFWQRTNPCRKKFAQTNIIIIFGQHRYIKRELNEIDLKHL